MTSCPFVYCFHFLCVLNKFLLFVIQFSSVLASSLLMKLVIKLLFQLRLEVLEFGESWIMQKGLLPRVGSKLRLLLARHGSNLTMRTAAVYTTQRQASSATDVVREQAQGFIKRPGYPSFESPRQCLAICPSLLHGWF